MPAPVKIDPKAAPKNGLKQVKVSATATAVPVSSEKTAEPEASVKDERKWGHLSRDCPGKPADSAHLCEEFNSDDDGVVTEYCTVRLG